MFEKSVYQLRKLVNNNILKSSKHCNKLYSYTMYPMYNILYTWNTLFNNNKSMIVTLNFKMY